MLNSGIKHNAEYMMASASDDRMIYILFVLWCKLASLLCLYCHPNAMQCVEKRQISNITQHESIYVNKEKYLCYVGWLVGYRHSDSNDTT